MYLSKRERAIIVATIRNLLSCTGQDDQLNMLIMLTDEELEETLNVLLASV